MKNHSALLWLPSVALLGAAADMALVAAGTGWLGVMRLACMVSVVYTLSGIISAAAVFLMRRSTTSSLLDDAGVLGLSLALWSLVVGGGYLNLVHLPSITSTVSLVANLALVAAAYGLWFFTARAPLALRVAGQPRNAIAVAATAMALTLLVSLPRPQTTEQPTRVQTQPQSVVSAIVVVVDSLRFDYTGLGGGTATPNIDALAERGTAYSRAYAQASWTKPSVASLFTSLYPSTHGANFRRDRLSAEPQTMAEMFADAGYRTAVFSANPWISPAFGFDRGIATFIESQHETFVRLVIMLRLLKLPDRVLPSKPASSALARLETLFGLSKERRSNCKRDVGLIDSFETWISAETRGPVFAYLHLMSPHIPYDPPGGPHDFANEDQVALLRSTDPLPAARRDLLVDLYLKTVSHGDRMIGRIMAILEEAKLSDSTILVVTSDHGEEFFEHGHWGHGKSLYDELVHIPLVMRGPGVEVGLEEQRAVMLVDIGPTLASLANVDPPSGIVGENVTAASDRDSAYAELIREGGVEMYMVYEAGKKYLESTAQLGQQLEIELYDLPSDPLEEVNLADKGLAAWPGILARIRGYARSARVAENTAQDISKNSEERLRALGYLN